MHTSAHLPPDLPPIADAHRMAAFTAMRWPGWTYEQALQFDLRRRLIECRAHHIRTKEWLATQARSVVPVKRVQLGSDGHPRGWCTQQARGDFAAADFFPTT